MMPSCAEAIAKTVDGHRCLDHIREIGHYDRSLGSQGYRAAAEYTAAALKRMGLTTRTVTWPMDDAPVPWNWSVPRAWEAQAAVFKVVSPEERTLVNLATTPTCLHPWSAATPPEGVTAQIVYVGSGLLNEDYAGKEVRGKIVFADRGANWQLYVQAIQKRGALGYISDDILEIPNVKTRRQYPDMVLWYTFYEREFESGGPIKGWGFSISPRMGDYLRGLLTRGPVTGYSQVEARTFDGVMENVLGSLDGADDADEEFVCMAHLDHYRPGAMDNAAGCAALLEAASSLSRLIEAGTLPRPRRSIRFLFGPEGHMSNVYPHSLGSGVKRIVGSWTVDTVGAKPHVVGGPLMFARASTATPTFLDDLGVSTLKESCLWYSGMGEASNSASGGTDAPVHTRPGVSPFKFEVIRYGIYSDNSCIAGWGVPAVGIFQWPSTIWHTQYDTIDRLDAGELARCAWATAVVSYQVAAAGPREALIWMHNVSGASRRRLASLARRARRELLAAESGGADALLGVRLDGLRYVAERDSLAIASCLPLARHAPNDVQAGLEVQRRRLVEDLVRQADAEGQAIQEVAGELAQPAGDGPLDRDTDPADILSVRPRRLRPGLINMKYQAISLGPRYSARDPLFMDRLAEMLNLSDGIRTISEITRIVTHEIGPIAPSLVAEMFKSIEELGFVTLHGN
ncbi:MAG: M28 family peptidase [bacterium]